MDLGRKLKLSSPGEPAVDPKKPKVSYPGLTLNDETAEAFNQAQDLDLGDEFTATVRCRVSGNRNDEYGQSISFDVLSMDDIKAGAEKEGEGEESDEEAEKVEEKALGYKRPAKPAPDVSAAADLED